MSTRSTIAILNENGTVSAKYCHSDGYLSYNGQILYEHYRDIDKVKTLVELGDMSSLEPELVSVNPEHSFDKRTPGVCVFYGRDRGEDNIEPQNYDSLENYLKNGNFQEYDYIFNEKRNSWYLINHKTKKLQTLHSCLLKDREVDDYIKDMIKAEKFKKKLDKDLPNKSDKDKKIKL